MVSRLAQQLRQRREALARDVAERVVRDPETDLTRDLDRLQAIDALLAALPTSRSRTVLAAAASALLCALLVWLAWSVRVDRLGFPTWVAIEATAERVELELNAGWRQISEPFELGLSDVRINGAGFAFNDRSVLFGELPEGSRVEIAPAKSQTKLHLASLALTKGGGLALERFGAHEVRAFIAGVATGAITITGDATIDWRGPSGEGGKEPVAFDPRGETLVFRSDRGRAEAVRLDFALPHGDDLVLRHLTVADVRFGREVQLLPGEPAVLSTIQSGVLRLPELDRSIVLEPGVGLQLKGLAGYVGEVRLSPGSEVIGITFQGQVDSVALLSLGSGGRPDGLRRDVTPSILAYLYQSQSLALVLAAVSAVWAALFYLRGLLSGGR